MTQTELADAAGIAQGTVSDLEAGRIFEPSAKVIEGVGAATGFPTRFFAQGPLPDLPDGSFRKLKRGRTKVSAQIRAQVRQLVEVVDQAEAVLRLPPVMVEPVRALSELDDVEEIAARTRLALNLAERDPIANVTRAVERGGIVVVRLTTEMEDHDGFSAWPSYGVGGRPIIAVASAAGDRNRFTIAHELGHLVLHTNRSQVEPKRAEQEANRFAGAFLIPAEAAREAMRPPVTLRVLMGVKVRFGTSIAMNAHRAKDLRLISDDQFVSLRKQLSARGWMKKEPVEVAPERPLLIGKALSMLAGEGSSVEQAKRIGMPVFTYRAVTSGVTASAHETQTEPAGRPIARKAKTELLLHGGKDGQVSERNSYGNDTYPPNE